MTVCLDRMNAAGHIDVYEEPCLYRCGLVCRLQFRYNGLHSMVPVCTRFHVHCDQLDFSLTDTQMPMFCRLLELAIALYYGELRGSKEPGPGGTGASEEAEDKVAEAVAAVPHLEAMAPGGESDPSGQSWASWAWSYVPAIMPAYEDEEGLEGEINPAELPPFVLVFGLFVKKAQFFFKVSDSWCCLRISLCYNPCWFLSAAKFYDWRRQGGIFQAVGLCAGPSAGLGGVGHSCSHARHHFLLCANRTHAGSSVRHRTSLRVRRFDGRCSRCPGGNMPDSHLLIFAFSQLLARPPQSVCLAKFGLGYTQDAALSYLTDSLFAESPAPLEDESWSSREAYLAAYTEQSVLRTFGALWFDYLYTLEIVKEGITEQDREFHL